MAVIRLSMHACHRPAGDCVCTAKTLDEAMQDLGAVENIVRDFGDANPTMLGWRSLAGVIAHLAADPVGSRTLIGEEIRVAQLFEVPIAFGVARRRRALTETGEQSLGTLREAITVLASTEASLELARASHQPGPGASARRSARRGRRSTGNRCGPGGSVRSHPQRKLTSGRRWRATTRSVLTSVGSLTPTELRVAQRARRASRTVGSRSRRSHRETRVAWHLRNIYRKLAIESRDQLLTLIDD